MSVARKMLGRLLELPDRREIWEWAAENIDFRNTTAFHGRYSVENSPWTREFLRAIKNPYVRRVTFVAPPQESGKTIAAEVALAHRICTKPAPIAYNITTNAKAAVWSETRFDRLVKACPALRTRFSADRHKKKKLRVIFRDGTFLLIQGAEVPGNRAGDSVEFQINDEVALWERPWLAEMHGRLLAYRDTRKEIQISTGGIKGGELHEQFVSGNQLEWMHHCPKCGQPFPYVHNPRDPRCNIHYDLGAAVIHADGRLDLREFQKTIYVQCPDKNCGERMFFDRERLARQNRAGIYVPQNPDANPEFVSLHVNAFAIGRQPWSEILEPYVRLHIRGGVFAPEVLREFVTKPCAEFWDEQPFFISSELKTAAYRRVDVFVPQQWDEELFRVMAVDNQHGQKGDTPHRKFVCRAFAKPDKNGISKSRLIDAGRLEEWTDVRKKQLELQVPDPTPERPGPWVVVDRRHNPVEVDEMCARYKWYGFMGAEQAEFVHPPYSPFAGTRQLFSEQRAIDVGFGTAGAGREYALYFLWSSQRVQDMWAQLRNAELAEVPMDIGTFCPEYVQEINSHRQIKQLKKGNQEQLLWAKITGSKDDLYDAECMITVIAFMAGIYKRE